MTLEITFCLSVQPTSRNETDKFLEENTRSLREGIKQLGVASVEFQKKEPVPEGTKSIDPFIAGALIISLTPTLLTKFLEFLHDWAMRRENNTLKIKIQAPDNSSVEIEVPASLPLSEAKKWISETAEIIIDTKTQKLNKKRSK